MAHSTGGDWRSHFRICDRCMEGMVEFCLALQDALVKAAGRSGAAGRRSVT